MADTKGHGDAVDEDLDEVFDDDVDVTPARESRSRPRSAPAKEKAPPGRKRTKAREEKRPNIFMRFQRFIREIVAELQKVIWPTRKELITYASVVVVFVSVMLTIVGVLDLGFARAMLFVFGSGKS